MSRRRPIHSTSPVNVSHPLGPGGPRPQGEQLQGDVGAHPDGGEEEVAEKQELVVGHRENLSAATDGRARRPKARASAPAVWLCLAEAGRIWRRRRTRSSIGGWVENRLAMPPPENGLTM